MIPASFSPTRPYISTRTAQVFKTVNCEEGPFHLANIWLPQMPASIATSSSQPSKAYVLLGISSPTHPHPTPTTPKCPHSGPCEDPAYSFEGFLGVSSAVDALVRVSAESHSTHTLVLLEWAQPSDWSAPGSVRVLKL